MNAHVVPQRRLWWLGAGFVAWCGGLCALYALHAIGCAFGWSTGGLRASLGAVFIVHLVVIGWMWRRFAQATPDPAHGETGGFLHQAIVWTTLVAFASTVLVLGPPLLLTTCI